MSSTSETNVRWPHESFHMAAGVTNTAAVETRARWMRGVLVIVIDGDCNRNTGGQSRAICENQKRMSAGNFGDQLERDGLSADLEPALRAADPIYPVQEELGADRTLQARAPEDRDELLVERAM